MGAGKGQLSKDKYCQNLDIRMEQEIIKNKMSLILIQQNNLHQILKITATLVTKAEYIISMVLVT